MTNKDIEYFERRRCECIERAGATEDPHLAAIYRAFAVQYTRALLTCATANDDEEAA
jgi:hypothetical protein